MTTSYTTHRQYPKPDFDTRAWHDQMYQSLDMIDADIHNSEIGFTGDAQLAAEAAAESAAEAAASAAAAAASTAFIVSPATFGAIGDGVTDDTIALQAAFDYAGAHIKAANENWNGVSGGTSAAVPVVDLGGLRYSTGPLQIPTQGYFRLRGNNAALVFSGTTLQTILTSSGSSGTYQLSIDGVNFVGGGHGLSLSNPNTDRAIWKITNCEFRAQSSQAIFTAAMGNRADGTPWGHLSTLLIIKHCTFDRAAQVLFNVCDTTVVEDCWVFIDRSNAIPSQGVFINRANGASLPNSQGVITVSIASPAVVSWTAHGLTVGTPIVFSTTGTLPPEIVPGTTYYVIGTGLTANAFQFSSTLGGAAVSTSGSQSGVHTALNTADYGFPRLILRNMFGVPNVGTYNPVTVTISIASPAVVNWLAHGLVVGSPVVFTTTGALPTGITAGVTYYVISSGLTLDAFQFSTSRGGAAVNTSGSQSGVQSANARVSNIRWIDNYTGQILCNGCRFGGEGAGMPIAMQISAPLSVSPFLPATAIVITDSWVYCGTSTDLNSGIVSLANNQIPNQIVIRNCNGPGSGRYIANPTGLNIAAYMAAWEAVSGQSSFKFFTIDIVTQAGVSAALLIPTALLPYGKLTTQVDRLALVDNDILIRQGGQWARQPVLPYATGTWIPSLLFGGANSGMTYTAQFGNYTKIGRIVFVTAQIGLSAKGISTGVATVAGLPFTARGVNSSFNSGYYAGMSGLVDGMGGRIVIGGTVMTLVTYSATQIVALSDPSFTNASTIYITFFYETDP